MNATEIVNLSKQEALGMYRINVSKYQATRWMYGTHNPQGGSCSSGGYKTQREALTQGMRSVPQGAEVLVTMAVWDPAYGGYRTTKQYLTTKE